MTEDVACLALFSYIGSFLIGFAIHLRGDGFVDKVLVRRFSWKSVR